MMQKIMLLYFLMFSGGREVRIGCGVGMLRA